MGLELGVGEGDGWSSGAPKAVARGGGGEEEGLELLEGGGGGGEEGSFGGGILGGALGLVGGSLGDDGAGGEGSSGVGVGSPPLSGGGELEGLQGKSDEVDPGSEMLVWFKPHATAIILSRSVPSARFITDPHLLLPM